MFQPNRYKSLNIIIDIISGVLNEKSSTEKIGNETVFKQLGEEVEEI